jgi:hypothetical protein
MKEAIFHCGRYPQLTLTVEPFGMKDKFGTKTKAKHLNFKADPEFGAGILRIHDEEMVKFVQNHEYFKNGKIIDVTDAKVKPTPKVENKVTTGVHSSIDVRTPHGEPVEGKREVKAARVPGKKK